VERPVPANLDTTQQSPTRAIDATLLALGFVRGDDGVLYGPTDCTVSFAPVGQFYELQISLANGDAVVAVLSKAAIKVTREGAKP